MSTASGRPTGAASSQARPSGSATAGRAGSPGGKAPAPGAASGSAGTVGAATRGDEPRKVRLTLSRIDPFSVMKISFLLSVAAAIAGVVVVAALWMMLSGMGVFSTLNQTLNELAQSTNQTEQINVLDVLSFGRVLSLAIVLGVANVILSTAIATLAAVIYNICAALVGGLASTFTDE